MSSFYTAEKERGIVGRPLPTMRGGGGHDLYGLHQVINVFCLYQVINVFLSIPGYRHLTCGSGHPRPLVYTRSSTILRLYQVISNFLVYTRSSTIPCLYQERSELFTPVAAVW